MNAILFCGIAQMSGKSSLPFTYSADMINLTRRRRSLARWKSLTRFLSTHAETTALQVLIPDWTLEIIPKHIPLLYNGRYASCVVLFRLL